MRKGTYRPFFAMLLSALVCMQLADPFTESAYAQETGQKEQQTEVQPEVQPTGEQQVQESEEETPSEMISGTRAEAGNATTEGETQITNTYQDGSGITYQWKGYADGTAEIYGMEAGEGQQGLTVAIPAEIDGYMVTAITGNLSQKQIETLTIPETIIRFGKSTFAENQIGTLIYQAVDAVNEENFFYCPFAYSEIEHLEIGSRVQAIHDRTFYQTVFRQPEVELHVPSIGKYAFDNASFETLTLTEDVRSIDCLAFSEAKIQKLNYNCPEAELAHVDSTSTSLFYDAKISELSLVETMDRIPDYLFANADLQMKEYVIDREYIGKMAFFGAWSNGVIENPIDRLTITKDVAFIGAKAFGQCKIRNLQYQADVQTDAVSSVTGIFYMSDLYGLEVADGVQTIPDYCFANAKLHIPEYTVTTPKIGTACFYNAWNAGGVKDEAVSLTVSETVAEIGKGAFASCEIAELSYQSRAELLADSTVNGPFYLAELYDFTIGEQLEEIPAYLFANTEFMEEKNLTIDMPVGDCAFYTDFSSNQGFGTLVIGESVTYMGKRAFYGRDIGTLSYQAVSAVNGNEDLTEAAFYNCDLGSLSIGEQVETLDGGSFCGIRLLQDTLVIPDSVSKIGSCCFYDPSTNHDWLQVNHLEIGKGLKELSYYGFYGLKFQTISVEAVTSGENYHASVPGEYIQYLPECETISIHRGSDFYDFFAAKAAKEHLYCDAYLIPSVGDEYFDEEKKQYVTPHYETCSVCGYQIRTDHYEQAFAVTFVADGKILDILYCKKNGTVTAPVVPEKDGFSFQGWDCDFSSVINDMTVTAVYAETEIPVTPTPEPAPDPEPEPAPDPEPSPEPEPEPNPEPMPNPEPEPEPEPTPNPEPKPNPEPVPEPEPTPNPEPKPNPKPVPEPKPSPELKPNPEPDPNPVPDPKPKPTPEPQEPQKANPVLKPEANPETLPEGKKPEKKPQADPAPDNEAENLPEKEIVDEPEPDRINSEQENPEPSSLQKNEKPHHFPFIPVAVSLLVGLGSSAGLLYLFFFRRRKVTGNIENAEGSAEAGLLVTLDDKKTYTNEMGTFVFQGMRRGNHELNVFDSLGSVVLSMNICTTGREDNQVFTVMQNSCIRVDAHKEGKQYLVDVVLP